MTFLHRLSLHTKFALGLAATALVVGGLTVVQEERATEGPAAGHFEGGGDRSRPSTPGVVNTPGTTEDVPAEVTAVAPVETGTGASARTRVVRAPTVTDRSAVENRAVDLEIAPPAADVVADVGGETDVAIEEATEPRGEIDLSPGVIARRAVLGDDPGPSRRGPAAGGGDVEGGLPAMPGLLGEAEAEALHSVELRERALARPWLSTSPIEPREQTDGSWLWHGPLFTATIAPDGAVSFHDRGVSYDAEAAAGSFDATDHAMDGAGVDPHAAERERFMEATAELRARLESDARSSDTENALHRLPGRLARIWGDEARSTASRRRSIFRLWDECDEGESGRVARETIVAFIRATIATGSDDAYSATEIAMLNATRESEEPFAPY